MDKKILKLISKAWMFMFLIAGICAEAQQKDKFNLGGNERTERGPMLIWSVAAFVVAFGLLLFLKIRHDKKKKEELKVQMKEQMKTMSSRTRTAGQGRSTTSKTRGATS